MATFTILTSPTLNVTFHHPSPLFSEHELQQIYLSHSRSVNKAKQDSQWSLQQSCSTRNIISTKVSCWQPTGRGIAGCCEARALRITIQPTHWSRLDWQPTSTQTWTAPLFTRCSLRLQRTGFRPVQDRNSRLLHYLHEIHMHITFFRSLRKGTRLFSGRLTVSIQLLRLHMLRGTRAMRSRPNPVGCLTKHSWP